MSCLLCEKPKIAFGDFVAPYCLFHNTEEIQRQCPCCKKTMLIRRNATKCQSCSTHKKPNLVIPLVYFIPKIEKIEIEKNESLNNSVLS